MSPFIKGPDPLAIPESSVNILFAFDNPSFKCSMIKWLGKKMLCSYAYTFSTPVTVAIKSVNKQGQGA